VRVRPCDTPSLAFTYIDQEYTREKVSVHPLDEFVALAKGSAMPGTEATFVPADPLPLPPPESLPAAVPASVYVWCNPITDLRPKLWSFDTFVRDNAWKWIGEESQDNEDYQKVDEVRWEGRVTA